MSRLDELIQELCPDGVEYKKLTDVANVLYGYPCDATMFNEANNGIPLIRIRNVLAGMTETYTTENIPQEYVIKKGDLLVGMDGNFHVGNWKMDEAFLCQRVCKIYAKNNENDILNGFLSHLLGPIMKKIENGKQSGTVKHLLVKDINSISISVPPLEVQREIVRILDCFTLLTAELTAELTARKKQYEYYQNILLTCDGFNIEPVDKKLGKEIQWLTLGEVCTLKAGKTISSTEIFHEPFGKYQYPCFGGNGLRGYVKSYNQEGNFSLIGRQGALCGNVCYASGKFYATEHAVVVEPKGKCDERFLYYILIAANLNQYKTAGAQPGLSVAKLEKVLVLIPSMSAQKRIVDILDRFDALCNDITIGLPAEIEARQKQYEYYRDKLLSFKEKK